MELLKTKIFNLTFWLPMVLSSIGYWLINSHGETLSDWFWLWLLFTLAHIPLTIRIYRIDHVPSLGFHLSSYWPWALMALFLSTLEVYYPDTYNSVELLVVAFGVHVGLTVIIYKLIEAPLKQLV